MKKILLSILLSSAVFASLKVDTTYAVLGEIVKRVGGNDVSVRVLASSKHDPHYIVPKQSFITKLSRADLLIINGAGLEASWLPPLIQNANNKSIQNGAKGFLDISRFVHLIDKPTSVSHGDGDIHIRGNPHYMTDPHTVTVIAITIANKLAELDSIHAKNYKNNLDVFLQEWTIYLEELDKKMSQCRDKKVIQYHDLFNYFLKRYQYKSFGNIEPSPGESPNADHTAEIINTVKENKIKLILQDVYHSKNMAEYIAKNSDSEVVIVPHEVLMLKGINTLKDFYNTIANQLCFE